MTNINLFKAGIKSTLQLEKGTNLSYQSQGVAIYDSTQIDQWNIGDFVSADYIINAEFGLNEREVIHATMVAMPGNSSITIYGRTNVTRQLLSVRSNATNSFAQLIVEPASTSVQGSVVSFFANYARSSRPLVKQSSVAMASNCSWAAATNVTSLNITVTGLIGPILVGQIVWNTNLPSTAIVTAWNSSTNTLTIGNFQPYSFSSQSNQNLIFNYGPTQALNDSNNLVIPNGFASVFVPDQAPILSSNTTDRLDIVAGYGITIGTNPSLNSLTFTNNGITRLQVAGQSPLDSTNSGLNYVNLATDANLRLVTDPITSTVTISSRGISTTTDDNTATTANSFTIKGSNGLTTSTSSGVITINNTNTGYNKISDGTTTTTAATRASTFLVRNGSGIGVTVTADGPLGDNLLINNTGVISIGGLTGALSSDQLISVVNSSSASSINIPVGAVNPVTGAFTTITNSGALYANGIMIVAGAATFNNGVTMSSGGSAVFNGALIANTTASINGALTINGATTFNSTIAAVSTVTFSGPSIFTGTVIQQQSQELYAAVASPGTAATFNFLRGAIFNVTGLTSNFTANFTNIPTSSPYTISTSLILNQGSSAYIPNVCVLNGVTQTIRWQGGTTPSGQANHIDVVNFTFVVNTTTTLANGTVLLLACQAASPTTDSSANNFTLTNTGSVTATNAVYPSSFTISSYSDQFGAAYPTAAYLQYNSNAFALGSINWTIEFFVNLSNSGYNGGIFSLQTNQYFASNTLSDIQMFLVGNGSQTQLLTAQTNTVTKDNSVNNITLTNTGTVTAGNATIPFAGTFSDQFNGSNYVSATSANFSPTIGNFTIEGYFYLTSLTQTIGIFSLAASASPTVTTQIAIQLTTANYFILNLNGKQVFDNTNVFASLLNQWIHFSVNRNGNTVTFFINGNIVYTTTDTSNYNGFNTIVIGKNTSAGSAGVIGYISNFRIVTGTAVYGANAYTPPAVALTAIQTSSTNIAAITGTALVQNTVYLTVAGNTYNTSQVLSTSTWYHMALVKNGTSVNLYVNGSSVWNTTGDNSVYTGTYLTIGTSGGGSLLTVTPAPFIGYISNFRITSNIAIYTGSFTVPTAPLGTTQSGGTNISSITTTTGYTVLASLTDYN